MLSLVCARVLSGVPALTTQCDDMKDGLAEQNMLVPLAPQNESFQAVSSPLSHADIVVVFARTVQIRSVA